MTTEKKQKQPVIAEALIQTAINLGQEQDMKLVELIGHMEIAKLEVFNRNVRAAAELASRSSAPDASADKPEQVASSPAEGEDKA